MSEPLRTIPPGKVGFTYQDYLLLPDDGKRYEIIDGELFATAAPVPRHQKILKKLLFRLMVELENRGLGEVYQAPIDLVLGERDVVQPDILFVRAERSKIVGDKHIEAAPDLVVEVLSESTRRADVSIKSTLYARSGVPFYWIVDPGADSVETFQLVEGAYKSNGRLRSPAVLQPVGFPELRIPLGEIFE